VNSKCSEASLLYVAFLANIFPPSFTVVRSFMVKPLAPDAPDRPFGISLVIA
jgi:hypothetical protein